MPDTPDTFRVGINYWPAASAMTWLAGYDPAVLRQDFGRIAAAGMDTVRIFLRWEDVQPTPTTISSSSLDAVIDTADAATDEGVDLIVTLFTGHMSGVNWIPNWATGSDDGDERFRVVSNGLVQPRSRVLRNWYTDSEIVDAQAMMADHVARALSGHPAIWAWDLGNESSNCTIPPDADAADRWLDRISSILRSHDRHVLVTIGTHLEDLENDRVIGPAEAARWCDFVCMHAYPAYADWSTGPLDADFVPFLAELTRWLGADTPVLLAELGQSTMPTGEPLGQLQVREGDAATYTARALDRLRDCGSIGALLWCYTDYAPHLHATPPFDLAVHEGTFGLWHGDGTPKPAVHEISARIGQPCAAATAPGSWLDVTIDEFRADRRHHLSRLYRRFTSAT